MASTIFISDLHRPTFAETYFYLHEQATLIRELFKPVRGEHSVIECVMLTGSRKGQRVTLAGVKYEIIPTPTTNPFINLPWSNKP